MFKSEMRTQNFAAGVAQGSVLGPVLYTLFTADIPVRIVIQMGTYADDTAIIATSENPANASSYIQNELSILEKRLEYWRIVINAEKSAQITFIPAKRSMSSCHVKRLGYTSQRDCKISWCSFGAKAHSLINKTFIRSGLLGWPRYKNVF